MYVCLYIFPYGSCITMFVPKTPSLALGGRYSAYASAFPCTRLSWSRVRDPRYKLMHTDWAHLVEFLCNSRTSYLLQVVVAPGFLSLGGRYCAYASEFTGTILFRPVAGGQAFLM